MKYQRRLEMGGYVDQHISQICGCAYHNDIR